MSQVKLFESKTVRSLWDSEKENWYFFCNRCYRNIDQKAPFQKGIGVI